MSLFKYYIIQVLCSTMIVTSFTSAACHSGNSEGNGLWLLQTLSVDFHPIHVATSTLLPRPVIDSINLVCMLFLASLVSRPYFHAGSLWFIAYGTSTSCGPLILKGLMCSEQITGHVKLVPSCHISALLKAFHLFSDILSGMWSCDNVVTN